MDSNHRYRIRNNPFWPAPGPAIRLPQQKPALSCRGPMVRIHLPPPASPSDEPIAHNRGRSLTATSSTGILSTSATASRALVPCARWVPLATESVSPAGGKRVTAGKRGRAMGAHVLAGIARPERAAAALAAGANTVIDLSPENLRDRLREQVYAATDGRVGA